MKHRIAAVALGWVVVAATVLPACGGDDVSADEARRIVISGLIDAGHPPLVAACVATAALEQHAPGELVNEAGTTSAAVNASVTAIAADCAAAQAPPPAATTTLAATTLAATTTPSTSAPSTIVPALSAGVCTTASQVLVALDAAALMDDPGPAAFAGWLGEAGERTELALLTAPDGNLRDLYVALDAALEELDGDTVGAELDGMAADLRGLVELGGCPADPAAPTDAQALASELTALDTTTPATTTPATTMPDPTTPDQVAVDVHDAIARITVSVPAEWTGQNAGVAATPFGPATRYLVRAPDPAVFDEVRIDGTGVGIYALDGTVDFPAMLAASAPARTCTLASETSYDDGVYVGVRRTYTECGGVPVSIVVVGAADPGARVAAYVEIRATAPDDRSIDVVLNSFYV